MSNIVLSPMELRALFVYSPIDGSLQWAQTGKGRRLNQVAGSRDRHGYLQTRINGRMYFNHRIAWAICTGSWPTGVIDHINGDTQDNRISNLRDVSRQTNQENQRKAAASNKTTGLLGASLNRKTGKFAASIQVNRKKKYLGLFATPDEAHAAYLSAKRAMHNGATI